MQRGIEPAKTKVIDRPVIIAHHYHSPMTVSRLHHTRYPEADINAQDQRTEATLSAATDLQNTLLIGSQR